MGPQDIILSNISSQKLCVVVVGLVKVKGQRRVAAAKVWKLMCDAREFSYQDKDVQR